MTEEKINQDYLDGLDEEDSADKKVAGRIFSGAENSEPKVNLDEEIEKNIRIRTMPHKFKISSQTNDKKTAVVGVVIMVVGLLVLVAAVYLAYVFLVNPQAGKKAPVVKNAPVVETEKPVVKTDTKNETTPVAENTSTPEVQATSTDILNGTSTTGIASSSLDNISTSTTPVAGAPVGAKVVSSLSVAEKALFGIDPLKADSDSDGDGFQDLSEVLGLYDPAGPGKITDNPHIGVYQNVPDKYSVFYPKNWRTQNLENGDSLIFTAADNSLIQVISQLNTNKETIKDWYNEQFPEAPVGDSSIYSRNGWQGIFQQDKEIFYLTDAASNRLYTISYVPAANNDLSFYNIFLMMINSFTVK